MTGLFEARARMPQPLLQREFVLDGEDAAVAWGVRLAALIQRDLQHVRGLSIYLHGDLGAGKTTLCRGFVQGFGHRGAVKSPTYTIVEPYELANINIYHFDLYRLDGAEELEFIGVDNYFNQPNTVCLFEWPERAAAALPAADLTLFLSDYCTGTAGYEVAPATSDPYACARKLVCRAESALGVELLKNLPSGVAR